MGQQKIYKIVDGDLIEDFHIDDDTKEMEQAMKNLFKDSNATSPLIYYDGDWNDKKRESIYTYATWKVDSRKPIFDTLYLAENVRNYILHNRFKPIFENLSGVKTPPLLFEYKNKINTDYFILYAYKNYEHYIDFEKSNIMERRKKTIIPSFEDFKSGLDQGKILLQSGYERRQPIYMKQPDDEVFLLSNLSPYRIFISELIKKEIEKLEPYGFEVVEADIVIIP